MIRSFCIGDGVYWAGRAPPT